MNITVTPTSLAEIAGLRDEYRKEMDCQIIHDSIHSRAGWSVEYAITIDGASAGYGSVAVSGPWKSAPVIYEYFLQRRFRSRLMDGFQALVGASRVNRVETQSNDVWLASMLHSFADTVKAESILFKDSLTTELAFPGACFREPTPEELPDVPPAQLASHGVLLVDDEVAASGGILFHYNRPYGDIYMEVREPFRRRGLGSFLVQELKRVCYAQGSVPAARCNPGNVGSRKTLQKAGFVPCGNILVGSVAL